MQHTPHSNPSIDRCYPQNYTNLLHIYSTECNKIVRYSQTLNDDVIRQLFNYPNNKQFDKKYFEVGPIQPRGHNAGVKGNFKRSTLDDHKFKNCEKNSQVSHQQTSKKFSNALENRKSDHNKPTHKNMHNNTHADSNQNSDGKYSQQSSILLKKLRNKLSKLSISYDQLQKEWDQNKISNEQMAIQQLRTIEQINFNNCQQFLKYQQHQQLQQTQLGHQLKYYSMNSNEDELSYDQMATSRKQRNSSYSSSNVFSKSIPIIKVQCKSIRLLNAPKKDRKYRKINRLVQNCQEVCKQEDQSQQQYMMRYAKSLSKVPATFKSSHVTQCQQNRLESL